MVGGGYLGKEKGHDVEIGALLGLFLSYLGVIIVACLSNKNQNQRTPDRPVSRR